MLTRRVEGSRLLSAGRLAETADDALLDVRTPEEFAAGHLAGAELIDFEAADFDTRIASLDKAAGYAVYCRSGNRSGQALERMAASGFTQVADLSGGVSAWSGAGRALVTG